MIKKKQNNIFCQKSKMLALNWKFIVRLPHELVLHNFVHAKRYYIQFDKDIDVIKIWRSVNVLDLPALCSH